MQWGGGGLAVGGGWALGVGLYLNLAWSLCLSWPLCFSWLLYCALHASEPAGPLCLFLTTVPFAVTVLFLADEPALISRSFRRTIVVPERISLLRIYHRLTEYFPPFVLAKDTFGASVMTMISPFSICIPTQLCCLPQWSAIHHDFAYLLCLSPWSWGILLIVSGRKEQVSSRTASSPPCCFWFRGSVGLYNRRTSFHSKDKYLIYVVRISRKHECIKYSDVIYG